MAARARQPERSADELDELTLRRAQRGDDAAARALIERYQTRVFALISRMVGPGRRAEVEDLAQDTFLQVFRALPGFASTGPARLSTWILTFATRRAIDALRRRAPTVLADPSPSPRADAAVRRAQAGAALEQAIAALSPDHRAAFLLREVHDLDYDELAAALDVDVGTVKSRLARARAALRVALADVAELADD